MDTDFKTSFVPKRPVASALPAQTVRAPGILNLLGFVLLIASLLSAGGVYVFRAKTVRDVAEAKQSLVRAKNAFEPSFIEELKSLDRRIESANLILDKHYVVTPVFRALEEITLPNVRYTNFDYSIDTQEKTRIRVEMLGEAASYEMVTVQADLFDKHPFIVNPIFSDFALSETGKIQFKVQFMVDHSLSAFRAYVNRLSVTKESPVIESQAVAPSASAEVETIATSESQ